ncbi:unnamed protein product [Cochlearia groenlandica]
MFSCDWTYGIKEVGSGDGLRERIMQPLFQNSPDSDSSNQSNEKEDLDYEDEVSDLEIPPSVLQQRAFSMKQGHYTDINEPLVPEVVVISSDSSMNPSYEFQFEAASSEISGNQNLSPESQWRKLMELINMDEMRARRERRQRRAQPEPERVPEVPIVPPVTSSFLRWVENNMNPVQPLPMMDTIEENFGEIYKNNHDEQQ